MIGIHVAGHFTFTCGCFYMETLGSSHTRPTLLTSFWLDGDMPSLELEKHWSSQGFLEFDVEVKCLTNQIELLLPVFESNARLQPDCVYLELEFNMSIIFIPGFVMIMD